MLGFVITTAIFIFVLLGTRFSIGAYDLEANWEAQRCRPDIMLTSSLYGKDATANAQHCINRGFDTRAKGAVLPFYTIMGSFGDVLTTLISSINSVKVTFATIVGGTYTVFTEFSSRIQSLFSRMQTNIVRLRFLMSRVFGSMHGILYMGQSAMQAAFNFERTGLWNTISNFSCFDPDTLVSLHGSVTKHFKDLRIGDTLADGQKITAVFRFNGDGQTMVILPGDILVSGLHRVLYNNEWIHARCHPDAIPTNDWNGGDERPLMCINTSNYSIQIGNYTFTDYDETPAGNYHAMETVMTMLNGIKPSSSIHFVRACHPDTRIQLKKTAIPANKITLGTELSHGTVRSIVEILTDVVCDYKGELFTPGTAVWSDELGLYKRVSELVVPRTLEEPLIFYSFMVSPSAVVETERGTIFRDYLELHSREVESSYANALQKSL
jgi:hypothetical protein